MTQKGFTIIEMLVVVTILLILATMSIQSFFAIKKGADVDTTAEEFMTVIKLAQNRTVSSENNAQYGVYLDTSSSPNRYIMFKGASYAGREVASDTIYALPKSVEFFGVSLGSVNEIVFDKFTGAASKSGTISVRSKVDSSQSKTMYVTSSGVINFASAAPPDDNRVKDSRHVHVDYNRTISIDANNNINEAITCTFYKTDGTTVVVTIGAGTSPVISGQIDTVCSTLVDGVSQTVSIQTHHLNDGNYAKKNQFSIHRDRRYNNKRVKITLSGDSSGSLIDYSTDGLTTTSSSTYVSPSVSSSNWQ